MAENTAAMLILLTNGKSQNLTLTSAKITGSSSASKLDLPPTLTQGTFGGYGTPASTTPYQAIWSYSPDGGATLLTFTCSLSGSRGIQIVPSKTGPAAGNWTLAEEPRYDRDAWDHLTGGGGLAGGILVDMHSHIFWLPVTRHSFRKSSACAAVDRPAASTQKTKPKETIRIEYSPKNRPPRDGTVDNIAPGARCLFRLDAGLFDHRPPQLDLGGELVAVRPTRRPGARLPGRVDPSLLAAAALL